MISPPRNTRNGKDAAFADSTFMNFSGRNKIGQSSAPDDPTVVTVGNSKEGKARSPLVKWVFTGLAFSVIAVLLCGQAPIPKARRKLAGGKDDNTGVAGDRPKLYRQSNELYTKYTRLNNALERHRKAGQKQSPQRDEPAREFEPLSIHPRDVTPQSDDEESPPMEVYKPKVLEMYNEGDTCFGFHEGYWFECTIIADLQINCPTSGQHYDEGTNKYCVKWENGGNMDDPAHPGQNGRQCDWWARNNLTLKPKIGDKCWIENKQGDLLKCQIITIDPVVSCKCWTQNAQYLQFESRFFVQIEGTEHQYEWNKVIRENEQFSFAHKKEKEHEDVSLKEAFDGTWNETKTKRYELGSGAYGQVYFTEIERTGKCYALKTLKKHSGYWEHMKNEHLASEIKSPFKINTYQTMQDQNMVYFLQELGRGGVLQDMLQNNYDVHTEENGRIYAACVIKAFRAIHAKGWCYRDLKPENVVLGEDGFLKIIDFGMAKKTRGRKTNTTCGTYEYLAPEIVRNKKEKKKRGYFGESADWWTLGILIFDIIYGQTPFCDANVCEMQRNIVKGIKDDNFPRKAGHFIRAKKSLPVSDEAKNLIKSLLTTDPKKRMKTVKNIEEHPWFRNSEKFSWDRLERKDPTLINFKPGSKIVKDEVSPRYEDQPDFPRSQQHLFKWAGRMQRVPEEPAEIKQKDLDAQYDCPPPPPRAHNTAFIRTGLDTSKKFEPMRIWAKKVGENEIMELKNCDETGNFNERHAGQFSFIADEFFMLDIDELYKVATPQGHIKEDCETNTWEIYSQDPRH